MSIRTSCHQFDSTILSLSLYKIKKMPIIFHESRKSKNIIQLIDNTLKNLYNLMVSSKIMAN